jgi:rod shape determining protein RodA
MASLSGPALETRSIAQRLLAVNWLLLTLVALIAAVGVSTLYSVAGGSFTPWADKHTIRLLIGLGLIVAIHRRGLRVDADELSELRG